MNRVAFTLFAAHRASPAEDIGLFFFKLTHCGRSLRTVNAR